MNFGLFQGATFFQTCYISRSYIGPPKLVLIFRKIRLLYYFTRILREFSTIILSSTHRFYFTRIKNHFFGLESDQAQYYGQEAVSKLYYTAHIAVLATEIWPLVTTDLTAVTIKSFSRDRKFISVLNNAFRFEETKKLISSKMLIFWKRLFLDIHFQINRPRNSDYPFSKYIYLIASGLLGSWGQFLSNHCWIYFFATTARTIGVFVANFSSDEFDWSKSVFSWIVSRRLNRSSWISWSELWFDWSNPLTNELE